MEEKVFNYIREQIEFLKVDLNRDVPLNMDSEFQPEAAAKIYAMKDESRRKILDLLNKLAGGELAQDEKKVYREMLVRITSDSKALDAAKDIAEGMDEDESKVAIIGRVMEKYESTKQEIAAKLIEKLG